MRRPAMVFLQAGPAAQLIIEIGLSRKIVARTVPDESWRGQRGDCAFAMTQVNVLK